MTRVLGIISGSGVDGWGGADVEAINPRTPWGEPSAPVQRFQRGRITVLQLARHGQPHCIPPHRVNYRANLWAMQHLGAARVIAINTVGGIDDSMPPGTLVVPDQIIDYTWGRDHTYWDDREAPMRHCDFTVPYDAACRQRLLDAAALENIPMKDGGVYGATQGPRLESAAEVRRMGRDGCQVVGMTGMPEAGLARELELPFASLGVVVNWAAGLGGKALDFDEIERQQKACIKDVRRVILRVTDELAKIIA